MNRELTAMLAAFFILSAGIGTISEAHPMESAGLNAKQGAIVAIAAHTAGGDLKKLDSALNEGLDAGLTVSEIKEILVQLYAYAGFPRSLNGLGTFQAVLEEREKKGIKDDPGKEPSRLPAGQGSVELGTEIQTRLIGAPATGKYIAFAPAIDRFLKGHLFGDIFGRDNLDFRSREIATIAALANVEGVDPQLQAHFAVGFNVGLTEAQMRGLISVLEARVGKKQAGNASEVLGKAMAARQAGPPPASAGSGKEQQEIHIAASLPASKGPEEYFTGSVRVEMLFKASEPSRVTGGRVTFEPGARTAWHIHPVGQTLIVTDGVGRIQRWNGLIEEFQAGDIVWIPPGVKHWHGAAPDRAMTHIAIQEQLDGKTADWMEKVDDVRDGK